jgi:hypothetical protein
MNKAATGKAFRCTNMLRSLVPRLGFFVSGEADLRAEPHVSGARMSLSSEDGAPAVWSEATEQKLLLPAWGTAVWST